MHYARKIDNNHTEIVNLLRQSHCSVLNLFRVGDNCPDLLIGYRGKNYLAEVKSEKGKLTEGQREFMRLWRGAPVIVGYNFEQIWGEITCWKRS